MSYQDESTPISASASAMPPVIAPVIAPARGRRSALADAIVLLGHGSRDAEAVAETNAFVAAYRAERAGRDPEAATGLAHPSVPVLHGFVELAEPHIAGVLDEAAALADRVIVVPLSLLAAGHVKNELPIILAAASKRHPKVLFHPTPAFGVDGELITAAAACAGKILAASERRPTSEAVLASSTSESNTPDTALIVVGRGSSDPDANGDFYKISRMLGECLGLRRSQPAFIGITEPRLEEALAMAARARPRRLLIVPYFLFTGVLMRRITAMVEAFAAQYPWIRCHLAPHLASHAQLFPIIDARLASVSGGQAPLACGTCQYRIPLGTLRDQVGGLKALLWSVRHSFTHAHAAPHAHAHQALTKHVLVCTNRECMNRGAALVLEGLRRRVRDAGRRGDIRISRTACLGRCGEGPTVVVYPDGIWYREVGVEDVPDLVDQHLLNDKLVARRVDSIL